MSLKGTTKQIFKFDLTAGSSDHLKIDALVWQYLKDVELKKKIPTKTLKLENIQILFIAIV